MLICFFLNTLLKHNFYAVKFTYFKGKIWQKCFLMSLCLKSPLLAPRHFSATIVLTFVEFNINRIMYYAVLCLSAFFFLACLFFVFEIHPCCCINQLFIYLLLNNIPLYGYATFFLSSTSWWTNIMSVSVFGNYKCSSGNVDTKLCVNIIFSRYLSVELLGFMASM